MADQEEKEVVTLDEQFVKYASMLEGRKKYSTTLDLYTIDYWLRQAHMLDDRNITMTDTGMLFFRFNKSEINFEEFGEFLNELSDFKRLNLKEVVSALCDCGSPGEHPVNVPQYRDYFQNRKPKNQL